MPWNLKIIYDLIQINRELYDQEIANASPAVEELKIRSDGSEKRVE